MIKKIVRIFVLFQMAIIKILLKRVLRIQKEILLIPREKYSIHMKVFTILQLGKEEV